ncbi:hypothetical protein AcW1_000277 [Taiwanofungus camphoratus]|nr:hypothetical protein AcW2_001227 [Antrodia cinnamomea]KAI0935883.1 hypothetical protein AcV5_004178 [Antrodia cinnamomea]KAI0963100.1 hypothetical protein AcW1_000277 [Antrodia cinnamomea]
MMKLDKRGDVSIAEIVIYIPILIVSFILVLRHGFTRRAGWIFLLILSIIRIVGGVTHVLSEQKPTNITLIIIYSIMEGAGVSPLLLATLGFLQTVGQNSLDNHPLMSGGTRLMGLVGVVALALTIAGGVTAGNATTESSLNSGTKLRHIGVILFAIVYGFILVVHIFCWSNKNQILRYRRTLLAGISFALPFLGVRVAYAVLSAFAPVTRSINSNGQVTYTTSTSALSKFSSTSGSWVLYLIMSVVAEYIVVLIYTTVGIKIPLENDTDYSRGMNTDAWEDEEMARFKP